MNIKLVLQVMQVDLGIYYFTLWLMMSFFTICLAILSLFGFYMYFTDESAKGGLILGIFFGILALFFSRHTDPREDNQKVG